MNSLAMRDYSIGVGGLSSSGEWVARALILGYRTTPPGWGGVKDRVIHRLLTLSTGYTQVRAYDVNITVIIVTRMASYPQAQESYPQSYPQVEA